MRIFILLFGIFCCATSVIWIKLTTVDPTMLAAVRLLGASLLLSPMFFLARARHVGAFTARHFRRCLLPGLLLGLHFISWIMGARMTWAANSSLIVNVLPVVMPFLLYFSVGERLTRGEIAGTSIAISGVLLLGWESYRLDPALLRGDLVCVGSMLLFAVYLTYARRNGDFAEIWLYIVPVYAIAGVICLALLPIISGMPKAVEAREWWFVLGLTVVPTVFGHSILNWGMKHLRGQLVAVMNLAQFIFAGLLAAWLLDEIPGKLFAIAATMVVLGAIVSIVTQPRKDG